MFNNWLIFIVFLVLVISPPLGIQSDGSKPRKSLDSIVSVSIPSFKPFTAAQTSLIFKV
ncbi:MAG: hypothetical protein HXX16_15290 [Bacteroidales bacterium]|nr:hypothetical protein [Bacteroidales bacterium]